MARYGEHDRQWQTGERGHDPERWRHEQSEARGGREDDLRSRDDWRGRGESGGREEGRREGWRGSDRDWRGSEEDRRLGGTRDPSMDRGGGWDRDRGGDRGREWDRDRGYGAAGYGYGSMGDYGRGGAGRMGGGEETRDRGYEGYGGMRDYTTYGSGVGPQERYGRHDDEGDARRDATGRYWAPDRRSAADWRTDERSAGIMERDDRGPLQKLGDALRGKGRGPKGYKRADDRIRDDVCERIARSGLDADDVEIKVEHGEVTLTGTVHDRDDKRRLEDVAEDVFGVDEVHNHLRVSRTTATTTTGEAGKPTNLKH